MIQRMLMPCSYPYLQFKHPGIAFHRGARFISRAADWAYAAAFFALVEELGIIGARRSGG